ncbi:DegT/DnrJ/EryC1/StrS family aminotransferase [Streptomyces iconiensis]|uniref:DegT/DnrJ/EryC1/StrS family aminotransferase n=1 Tax=Streptomyces iconiensis TaxID=1384038 RepID=A0ABT6ZPH7_9ACTN|nr:DegT/DnrJ/EryC1/StrS family aminotransferase [Streptomyces iconiensis]MDJ1130767.1 DegT/DnrJ/EryC1/StrS family aminotransferase [Streptomyces iconiensis]
MTRLALHGGEPLLKPVERPKWPNVTEDDIEAVTALLRRGEITYNGSEGEVQALENGYRSLLGSAHALAVNSGTSALHSAFFGLDLRPGDEVIAPAYTFLATAMPVFTCNAVPVLADVDPETGMLDAGGLAAHLTPRTRAVVVTHLMGFPADMARITAFARAHGLAVVEDCSQSHGAACSGRPVGRHGDVAAFSLQAKKQVAAGEGGVLVTDDRRIYERAVMLGHCIDRGEQDVTSEEYGAYGRTGFGLNYRIHPVGAALARGALSRLDAVLTARESNYSLLGALLEAIPGITPPVRRDHVDRVAHYVSYQPRYVPGELGGLPIDVFTEAVRAEGVPMSRPTSPPLHREAAFQSATWHTGTYHPGDNAYRVYDGTEFPGVDGYLARALRLPVYSDDRPGLMKGWAEAISKVVDNAGELLARHASGAPAAQGAG